MGRLYDIPQHSFGSGVVDETMRNRVDLRQYNSGLIRGENVYIRPQGNAEGREGLGFIDIQYNQVEMVIGPVVTAPNGGDVALINDGDLSTLFTTNSIGAAEDVVIVEYDFEGVNYNILFVDVRDISLDTGSLNNNLYVEYWNGTDWVEMTFFDAGISQKPLSRRASSYVGALGSKVRLIKKGTDNIGALSIGEMDVYFDNSKLSECQHFDFKFNEDEQSYKMILTAYNIAVYRYDLWQADIRVPYSDDEVLDVTFNQSADTMILCHPDHPPQKIIRRGSDTRWNFEDIEFAYTPRFAFEPELVLAGPNVTPSAKSGSIKLTAAFALWVDSDVQGLFNGNGGQARITKIQSNTVAEAVVLLDFIDTNAISDWTLIRNNEEVWSEERGWPNCSVFHLSRLWFGGSKSRPQTIWGSVINDFFNFDVGGGFPDQAIDTTLDTDTVNKIRHLKSSDELEIFTSGAEFFAPKEKEGLTPQFFKAVEQDTRGIGHIAPVRVDGATFFIQKKSNIMREFRFNDLDQKFNAGNITILAQKILNNPRSLATVPPVGDTRPNDLIYVANEDGTAGFFNTLKSQNIASWSNGYPADTKAGKSKFISFGPHEDNMYATVERTINGQTIHYLEKFVFERTLDSSILLTSPSAKSNWSVPHLAGETVMIKTEFGLDENTYEVDDQGNLEVPYESNELEVGLAWLPLVEPLSPVVVFADGTLLQKKRRIVSANVAFIDTEFIEINGERQPTRLYEVDGYDEIPAPFSGSIEVPGFGTSREPTTVISQYLPGKFNVSAIVEKVSS